MTDNASQCGAITRQIEAIDTRMLRGQALANHVMAGLAGKGSAASIAAPYSVARCARLLALAHEAPLARRLFSRDAVDHATRYTVLDIETAPEPPTIVKRVHARDLPRRLCELGAEGCPWSEVPGRLGRTASGLRWWIYSHGMADLVARWWPDMFPRAAAEAAWPTILAELEDLAEAGVSWPEALKRCGWRYKSESLAKRLEREGRYDLIKAFGAWKRVAA